MIDVRELNSSGLKKKATILFRKFQDTDSSSPQPTKIETWSDRLIDRDNYWLNAVNLEDDGNLFDAVIFYLQDAGACLKKHSLVRAALSCSCAATCLAKTGNSKHANSLYREAATLYEENADSIISESIRESLWSLEEAYEYYFVADEFENAQIVYDKYMSLATRTSPLLGLEERKETLEFRKLNSQVIKFNDRSLPTRQITSEVIGAVEQLLELRKSTRQYDIDLGTHPEITFHNLSFLSGS